MGDPELAAEAVEKFAFDLPLTAINDIVTAVQSELEVIGSSAVSIEAREGAGGSHEESPPNS